MEYDHCGDPIESSEDLTEKDRDFFLFRKLTVAVIKSG